MIRALQYTLFFFLSLLGYNSLFAQTTLYSYTSGDWNTASTWTTDAGGTMLVGSKVPSDGDVVIILPSRTVTLSADVATLNLDITIQAGGFLDNGIYRFTQTLDALRGEGSLKIGSANFPASATNSFVQSGGGITEYYNSSSFTMPSQTTYNHLIINPSDGVVVTQMSNILLNGNLTIKKGNYRINDNTSTSIKSLTINGNTQIDQGASFTVGQGKTNTVDSPLSIGGGTAPFLNYYLNFHTIIVNGDFTNNGTVRFTNLDYPIYNAFPSAAGKTGAATVYFQGSSNNSLSCNGTTDFYNLVVDKGSDQTYTLTVYSTAYNNFRLFGANTAGGNNGGNNPDLKKALWIRTGTMILRGMTTIPSLSEGTCAAETPAANPNSDFYIPANAALIIDGPEVVVLSTADDYREVNVAYGVSIPNNAAAGITQGGCSSYSIYGKIQINDGYFSTRESGGFITWDVASGEFEINGGIVDAKQFRAAGGAGGLASFDQSAGLFLLRGRFQRTPVQYTTMSDLTDVTTNTLNTVRATEGALDGSVGTFNLNSAANVFTMTGGTIRIYDVCRAATPNFALQINSAPANINVTGGTVEIIPTTGSVTADVNYPVSSTSPFGNFSVARASGTRSVQLNTNGLNVLNNLTISSGVLVANNLNVVVGGNFTLASGTTFTPGNNTLTFNGTGNRTFTMEGTITTGFNNLVIDKGSGSLTLSKITPATYAVANSFDLLSGTFNTGGNTLNIAGNVTNSGIHTGTGAIVLNDNNGAQTIGGDGTGVFENLTLNNTNGANGSSQISLTANIGVNGTLNLANNRIFNLNTYLLDLGPSATISGTFSISRFIATTGNVGDRGIRKAFSNNSFTFPIGVIPTAIRYTPTTVTITGTPATYGSISVSPVDAEQMQTSPNGKNRSLTYFWRVREEGFDLGSATISQTFQYDQSDVYTPTGNVTEDGYVPARYDPSSYSWMNGLASEVDETNNIINWPNNVTYIEGDYTAGDNDPQDPFADVLVYFSNESGNWRGNTTWMTDTTDPGSTVAQDPDQNIPVMIRNGHTINCDQNGNTSGALQIQAGGVLDCNTRTGLGFGVVSNPVAGSGKIRISRTAATTTFPSGDFSDFLGPVGGTVEYYATAGQTFTIPTTSVSGDPLTTYCNLIVSPVNGQSITMPDLNLTIYGSFTAQGTGSGTVRLNEANNRTLTVQNDINVLSGILQFMDNNRPQTLIVEGDVNISSGASFNHENSAGTTNTLTIYGDLVNDGTFDMNESSVCNVIFAGPDNARITGASTMTDFYTLTVNKGSSQATTLTMDLGGSLTTPANNWLTLQNGTLRFMRVDPSSDFTISTTTPFTIPATAGLYVDYANSGNRNILIANANSNNNDLYLNGKLTLVNGNIYIGPVAAPGNNNDIEYSGGGYSEIEVSGGNLVVNGQIRRNPATTAGILSYSQSGGNVTINGNSAIASNAKLEILNDGSSFNMSGNSVLTIVRGGGAGTYGDLYIRPEASLVTGGTIVFAHDLSGQPQSYLLDASVPLYNLTITGRTNAVAANAQVNLLVNPLTLKGSLLLSNNNSIFNSNNIDVTIKGDLTNNGTLSSFLYGTNTTTFNGDLQVITGSSPTNFYNLTISPVTSLSLTNNTTVFNNLTLSGGTFICGAFAVNLKGNLTNNATYTDTQYGVILNDNTRQQLISGTGTFGRLELDNPFGAKILNNITLQKDLALTDGVFDINQYLLTLGLNSLITGGPFGVTKMITSNGAFSNIGIRKFFNTSATVFEYPIGVEGKYTPAILTINNNGSVGSIRVNAINDNHPAVNDPNNVLDYFWELESSGITDFDGNVVYYYDESDVQGVLENQYVAGRLVVPGTNWSKAAPGPGTDNVDETSNTISFSFQAGTSNLNGEYTAGTDAAIPNTVVTYTSNGNGDWTNKSIWTPEAPDGGPNGCIVIIRSTDTITLNTNNCFAYRTTITGKLKAVSPYLGHNLGTVTGSGILYMEYGNLPAGRFTSFFDCSTGGTLQYGGTGTYTLIADRLDIIPKIWFIGSGTRVLPNKDLTICHQLLIDGPTLDNSVYNRKLTIEGTMERISGKFTSGTGASATVTFSGTAAQSLGVAAGDFTAPDNAFNNLEINNSAGLTLGSEIDIKNQLLLTDGIIFSSTANILNIVNTSTNCVIPEGGSINSYIDGPLAKIINQGDYFLYPLGKDSQPGNFLTVSSTRTGTLTWTAEYFVPNTSSGDMSSPLTMVNPDGYWTISSTAGSEAKIRINWIPESGLTPLMTEDGVGGMRISRFNSPNWTEMSSVTSGDNYNGYAQTTDRYAFTSGTGDFTLACIGTIRARARFNPSGPICGNAGIPIEFSSSLPISLDYSLSYTIDGVAQPPATVNSLPYSLPTASAGEYQLTAFTYNNGLGSGVVDIATVDVYANPTAADAGPDQTGLATCGQTSTTLAANNPVIGTGLWSITSGTGGTVETPALPASEFSGTNGSTYVLRWTISNGECISSDEMTVTFNLLPAQPEIFVSYDNSVCPGENNVGYSVPNDATVTYSWAYTGNDATINGTGNSVTVDFGALSTSGTLSVTANNGCGASVPRSIDITVNPLPTITLISGIAEACYGQNSADLEYSGTTGSPDVYSISYGAAAISEGFLNVNNAPLPLTPVTLVVPVTAPSDNYTADIYVTNTTTGCVSDANSFTVTVHPLPVPTITGADTTCVGNTVQYVTENGMSGYTWTITPASGTIIPPGDTFNPQVTWGDVTGQHEDREVTVNYIDANGCTASSPSIMTIRVFRIPQAGPTYHIDNTWNE